MRDKGKIFFRIAITLCAVVALYSGFRIFTISNQYQKGKQGFETLAEAYRIEEPKVSPSVQESETAEKNGEEGFLTGDLSGEMSTPEEVVPEARLTVDLAQMKLDYPHLVGWLQIPGTKLDYPMMQTPQEPNYYLHRDMEGRDSSYGVPYLQENCDVKESDNLIVYGHHMKNGDMFGSLMEYQNADFWKENRIIYLWLEEEAREYEIFAVFKTSASVTNTNIFAYNSFVNAEKEEAYHTFVKQVKNLAFYETNIIPQYGEQLLTLSTCEYTLEDGRLVVMGRRIK